MNFCEKLLKYDLQPKYSLKIMCRSGTVVISENLGKFPNLLKFSEITVPLNLQKTLVRLQFRAECCCLSIQPEAKTLDFSTHPLLRNLHKIFPPYEHKGSVVKQSGNDVEGCRSQKVLVQPSMYGGPQGSIQ